MKFLLKLISVLLLLGILAFVGVYFFGTTDLRTTTAKNNPDEAKAKQLLKDMAAAHQIQYWDSLTTYSVTYGEEFFGSIGQSSHPFPEHKNQFKLSYIPNTYDGRLEFLKGPSKGDVWGIQSWNTYLSDASNVNKFQNDQNVFFWVPTYQYFIEFPLRIQNADALAYAGQATINGKNCEGVLASWNTTAPQRDIDQYLIWLDSDTKRIVKMEYTVREMFNFITGAASYNDYQDFNGIILPSKMPVESNLVSDGFLHEMSILDFARNEVPVEKIRPNANLPVMGDEK